MQTVFGISYINGNKKIHLFLEKISSTLNKKKLQTYSNENIGYGFEVNKRASFKKAIEFQGGLSILLIGDFLYKEQVERDLSIIKNELSNEHVDIYQHFKEKVGNYINQVEGVHCVILIDLIESRICIFSDPYGLIPIYFYNNEDIFVFGTSLKCVLAYSDIPRSLNHKVIYELFKLGFTIPPSTLITDIKMLMPGEILEFSKSVSIKKPVRSGLTIIENIDINATVEEYYKYLKDSILTYTKGFDSCALLLSGGIDSAVIAAILAESSNIKLKCYTIDFSQEHPIEILGAQRVSALFNLDHYIINRLTNKMVKYFPEVVWLNEAPIFNGITEYILCNEINDDIELILTGKGNDLSWGILKEPNNYLHQNGLDFHDLYLRMRGTITDKLLDNIILDPIDKLFTYEKINQNYTDTGNLFRDLIVADLRLYGKSGSSNVYGKISIDPNQHLFRFPYLNKNIENLIKTIPDSFKLRYMNQQPIKKYLFKYTLERKKLLPNEIIHTKKTWMSSPNAEWLRGDLKFFFEEVIFDKHSAIKNYFNINLVKDLWYLHLKRKQDYSYFLIMLFTFELWHKIFIEGNNVMTLEDISSININN